ncbi:MAG TPA: hypothetical protein VK973_07190, partial [Arenicellales bacterium]|nr:hypothetical protein [Arenicellales bacterium]
MAQLDSTIFHTGQHVVFRMRSIVASGDGDLNQAGFNASVGSANPVLESCLAVKVRRRCETYVAV